MRRGHKTWKEISSHLEQREGVKSDYRTIQNFFKRWHDRQMKMPMGWEKMTPETTLLAKIKRV
jgi:hypothetical protein